MSLFLPHRRFLLGARAFDLDRWLVDNNGAYFDFTRTDTTFQESVGPTPADDVGEPIGLALSRAGWGGRTLAQVVGDSPELCVNGTFDTDLTGWTDASTAPSNVTWSSGRASLNAGSTARLRQGIAITAGRIMRFAATVVSGSIAISLGSSAGGTQYANQVATASTVLFATTTGASFWVGWYGGTTALVDDNSVREVARHSALQTTANSRAQRQAAGGKFDGGDDSLLTNVYAGAGGNYVAAVVTVPASLAAVQVVTGLNSGTARFYVAIDTSGRACGGVGTDGTGTITGTTDLRGQRVVIGLSCDGSTVRLFVDDAEEYTGAQNGAPTTGTPYRIGANNSAGTAANFWGGWVEKVAPVQVAADLARHRQVKAALLAA